MEGPWAAGGHGSFVLGQWTLVDVHLAGTSLLCFIRQMLMFLVHIFLSLWGSIQERGSHIHCRQSSLVTNLCACRAEMDTRRSQRCRDYRHWGTHGAGGGSPPEPRLSHTLLAVTGTPGGGTRAVLLLNSCHSFSCLTAVPCFCLPASP